MWLEAYSRPQVIICLQVHRLICAPRGGQDETVTTAKRCNYTKCITRTNNVSRRERGHTSFPPPNLSFNPFNLSREYARPVYCQVLTECTTLYNNNHVELTSSVEAFLAMLFPTTEARPFLEARLS